MNKGGQSKMQNKAKLRKIVTPNPFMGEGSAENNCRRRSEYMSSTKQACPKGIASTCRTEALCDLSLPKGEGGSPVSSDQDEHFAKQTQSIAFSIENQELPKKQTQFFSLVSGLSSLNQNAKQSQIKSKIWANPDVYPSVLYGVLRNKPKICEICGFDFCKTKPISTPNSLSCEALAKQDGLSSLVCFTKQTQIVPFQSKIEDRKSSMRKTKPNYTQSNLAGI
jgi:hypothetical protein